MEIRINLTSMLESCRLPGASDDFSAHCSCQVCLIRYAIKFSDVDIRDRVAARFKVKGMPKLVLVDGRGQLIASEGVFLFLIVAAAWSTNPWRLLFSNSIFCSVDNDVDRAERSACQVFPQVPRILD